MSSVTPLHAPISGWIGELGEVPDEVFAGRMMGDGIAIDPLGAELVAPCDGIVVLIAPTRHAITLRAENGAEILLHIGLETVALQGRGFDAAVSAGQQVRRGDLLISFDLDAVAHEARSLITPIVVTNSDLYRVTRTRSGRVSAGDQVATIERLAPATETQHGPDGISAAAELVVNLPNGLHARPAARIAALAKSFSSEIVLHANRREAKARSPVSVMALDVRAGDRIEIVAKGPDAANAIEALSNLIGHELEALEDAPPARRRPTPSSPAASSGEPGLLRGVCAVPGMAVGPAFHLNVQAQLVAQQGAGEAVEAEKLRRALALVRVSLAATAADPSKIVASVAAAHLELVDDQDILAAASAGVSQGESAGYAYRAAIAAVADRLAATRNPLLAERIDDLHDVERQVLDALAGNAPGALPEIPEGAIVLADEILPSQVPALAGKAAGLCTEGGGPTSHVAILAAAAGLPTLVAIGHELASVSNGTQLLLEATAGRAKIAPDAETLAAARTQIDVAQTGRARAAEAALAECRTADGSRIEIFANLASIGQAADAVASGAEGCGLLRTEFLFLDRTAAPDEEEQRAAYQDVADALAGRPLIVRTLDVGGDKALPYLPIPAEDNPALGLRGVRVSLWRPELLDEQLRAILRVQPTGRCRIMIPMISGAGELRAVRKRLDAAAASLGVAAPPLGIMIETPAAALLADQLAAEADFFSVGTNDLTQYALAMDRTNRLVAAQVDAFHPAVLRLIEAAANGAQAHGRTIGACGGLASDPHGALLLVGLGLTELSATPTAIAAVKESLRSATVEQCRQLAGEALRQSSPQAVREMLANAHPNTGSPAC